MKLGKMSRRQVVIAGGAAAVAAFAIVEGHHLWKARYAPSPYDDLLLKLDDRDADAQIGEAVLADLPDFDAKAVAAKLRTQLSRGALSDAVAADAAAGRITEANGWVLPESLAMLCALAAKANG